MTYAADVTTAGIELFAKILANEADLTFSRLMVGTGEMPEGVTIAEMTDLVQPMAQAVGSDITYADGTVNFTVEYRNDLNGGLDTGFDIREYGVFVRDPTDGNKEVLVFYGNLDAHPQNVPAYVEGDPIDIRDYPVSIAVGAGQNIVVEYSSTALLTREDVIRIAKEDVLPDFLAGDVTDAIAAHNADPTAHSNMRSELSSLDGRVSTLELMLTANITDNQFTVTFEDLDEVTATGVWNEPQARIEY